MFRSACTALLLGTLLATGQPPAAAGNVDFGRTWASDKVLKPGCHGYRFQYRVFPGSPEWMLETFLKDPDGERIAHRVFSSEIHGKRGSGRFRVCRYVTRPGRFKIPGKLTIYEGHDQNVVWVKPGYFRMNRAS